MTEKWRDHGVCVGNICGLTINAEEKVGSGRGYDLVIYHVTNAAGERGFLPSVRLGTSCIANGKFVPGTSEAAFADAQKEGVGLQILESGAS